MCSECTAGSYSPIAGKSPVANQMHVNTAQAGRTHYDSYIDPKKTIHLLKGIETLKRAAVI